MQKAYADILRQILKPMNRYPSRYADIMRHSLEFYHEHCNMSDRDFIFLISIVDTALAPFVETYRAGYKNGEATARQAVTEEFREMLGDDLVPEEMDTEASSEDYEDEIGEVDNLEEDEEDDNT